LVHIKTRSSLGGGKAARFSKSRYISVYGWVVVPISKPVDLIKHEGNDLGSSGLKNSILLVDAVKEGVINSVHELINYNRHKEPELLGIVQIMAETNKDSEVIDLS